MSTTNAVAATRARPPFALNALNVFDSKYSDGSTPVPSPLILDTDIISGSLTGSHTGFGSWMKVFGYGLGTLSTFKAYFRDPLGDNAWHEVAAYQYVQASRCASKVTGLQVACFQIGSLGGAMVNGRTLDFKIKTNGVDSNILSAWFKIQPGNTWYVSASGSDSTGVVNDKAHPFQYAQKWTGSTFTGVCATGNLAPGDTVVYLGGSYSDDFGYNGSGNPPTVFKFATTSSSWAVGVGGGKAPNGTIGNGYIHFLAYPGDPGVGPDDVHFTLSGGGGFQGVESSFASSTPGTGKGWYVSISGFHGEMTSTAARDGSIVNGQNGAFYWRIYDNECGPWATGTGITNAGGVVGDFHYSNIAFNHIHDISGNLTDLQNHGIYLGGANGGSYNGASQYTKCFGNWIHDIPAGSCFQDYWQGIGVASLDKDAVFVGIEVYGNYMDTCAKYGVNLGKSIVSAKVYNNVIVNTGLNPLRIEGLNTAGQPTFDVSIVMNTIYGWNTRGSVHDACLLVEGYENSGSFIVRHNIFAGASGRSVTNSWYENSSVAGNDSAITMDQNVHWDFAGTLTGHAAKDSNAIVTSPNFTNRATGDFTLAAGSSALGAVTTAEGFVVTTDFLSAPRPKATNKDCGAYES